MHYQTYLAGFRFSTEVFSTERENCVLVRNYNFNIKRSVFSNFERYDFGQRTICYSPSHEIIHVFFNQDTQIEVFSASVKSSKSNGRQNIIKVFSRNLNESGFTFCAYYWLYSFYPKLIAVPGKLKFHNSKRIIEYTNNGCKVVLFDLGGRIFFHQFGLGESFPISELGGFSGFGTDKIYEILLMTGSRPFWSWERMKKWLEFIDDLTC